MSRRHAFHEEDYSVDCNSGKYLASKIISFMLIVLVSFGVPGIFMFYMYQAKKKLGGVRQTALGGAKLVDDDVEDDVDPFNYLCSDLKPEFYYCE